MMGFVIMGFIGYIVKLVFIPINNIILSWARQYPNLIRVNLLLFDEAKR